MYTPIGIYYCYLQTCYVRYGNESRKSCLTYTPFATLGYYNVQLNTCQTTNVYTCISKYAR